MLERCCGKEQQCAAHVGCAQSGRVVSQWQRQRAPCLQLWAAANICAVSSPEKLMNGRDFAADDSTAILDS